MLTKYRLMVPGPTPAPPEVALAGALPLVDERGASFGELFHRVTDNLRRLMRTDNDVLTFASSLTGAFEGALQNLFSPGERILVANNGYFGQRWLQMALTLGLDVVEVRSARGEKTDMTMVQAALDEDRSIKGAICVACETSTGVVNDVAAFGAASAGVISIVDAASALGACELRADDWEIDVVVAGSQKALMTPPGLAFASVSERAWSANGRATMPRFYFDWSAAKSAYAERAATPWTPAIGLVVQLDVALQQLFTEGLDEVLQRHVLLGRAARAGLKTLGLRLLVPDEDSSSVVTTAWLPEGIGATALVELLVREHGLQLAGGNGELAELVLRIGHCGYVDAYDVIAALAAIELALEGLGHPVELGHAVGAAQRVFSRTRLTA